MNIKDIAEGMEYAWIEEGDGVYIACERTGVERYMDRKQASEFIRNELRTDRGRAFKHRQAILARAHGDEFAEYLNGLVGFTGERE